MKTPLPDPTLSAPVTLLHVEDDPSQTKLLARLAGQSATPISITAVPTLHQALAILAIDTFDVCLLDLGLPDSVGLATLRSVAALRPEQPIVVLTGESDPWLALGAIKMGAQDFLVKDHMDLMGLMRTIQFAALRSRQQMLANTMVSSTVLLQALPVPVAVVDVVGAVLWSNPAWQIQVGGHRDDTVVDLNWLAASPDGTWVELAPLMDQSGKASIPRRYQILRCSVGAGQIYEAITLVPAKASRG
ncbi:MAG: response regulator [Myxococcales bacterium]|nr:response regulator [Myxococcales bacterium]